MDSAQKIASSQVNDRHDLALQPTVKADSFESQLQQGLYIPFSELTTHKAGWSYRQSPVMVHGLTTNENKLHLTTCNSTLSHSQHWVWITTDHTQQTLQQCEDCLSKTNYKGFKNSTADQRKDIQQHFTFLEYVQEHCHEYFSTQKIKLWQPGKLLENLPILVPKDKDDAVDIIDYEQCQNCTWKLPLNSNYSFSKEQRHSIGCDDAYCILCMGDNINRALIIPDQLRWKALQARYHYFDGVSTNWAHVQFHIDKSWHPLIEVMRQQGINLPNLYQPITCEGYVTLISPLVWKDQKRAILPDQYDDRIQLPNDWDFWHYTQVYASFTGQG